MPNVSPVIVTSSVVRFNTNTSGVETQTDNSRVDHRFTNSFSGTSNGNYKRAIANGSNATTSAQGTLFSDVSLSPLSFKFSSTTGGKNKIRGSNSLLLLPSGVRPTYPGVFELLEQKARAAAYSRMRSGFNASTFLGEMREALAMIKRPAVGLRTSIDVYRRRADTLRRRYRKLRDWRRAAADLWLEYNFGWAPVVSDIKSAIDAYNRTAENRNAIPFTGSSTQTCRSSVTNTTSAVQVGEVKILTQVESQLTVRYKGAVHYKSPHGKMAYEFGSTWPDFVPTAWELMPWSFLIDYFSNVGAIANSWSTAQLVSTGWTCRTEYEVHNVKTSALTGRSLSAQYKVDQFDAGAGTLTLKKFSRSVPDGASVPLPELSLETDLKISQILNIAALVAAQRWDFGFNRPSLK